MFTMPDMAKGAGPTKPVTLRLKPDLMKRLREFGNSREFPVTLTDLIDTAVREFLDRREQPEAKKPRR
jgi:hypothetical protein